MPDISATYRLQLHAGFPLSRVRALVPYLHRLGISHLHCSPMLRARRGSPHGYDVVDPSVLNPELGSDAELEALHHELRERGMGIVLDIVPNHMAASEENAAWEDVLAHGSASPFARWFDIDWRANERELRYRVLLPVLGDLRARVLERREISLVLEHGIPRVRYFEHGFPLDPSTLPPVLAAGSSACDAALGRDHLASVGLREVIQALRALPRRSATRPRAVARRREESAAALDRLRSLAADYPQLASALGDAAASYPDGPEGLFRLRRLLDAQVYRLVYWRRAAREINYRRFFDVNDLVALHMEDPEVFSQTHSLVLEWRRRGRVDGLRIDHPDGLLDPRGYFERLEAAAFPESGAGRPPVWVEKILSHGEGLRQEWRVAGTTGYDFLNQAESLFISPAGYEALVREYHRVIRRPMDFLSVASQGKRIALETGFSAVVRRLAERLLKLAGPDRPLPRVPLHALARAILETIAVLPVYRTYVDESHPLPAGEDRRLLEGALAEARARGRASGEALDLLESALLATAGSLGDPSRERFRVRFVQRFQQLSGPATAKGVEDTAFYVFTPLLSRNEVGGGPEAPLEHAVEDFHAGNALRAAHFPQAMLAVTTHDTKRTADVRARLDVLSEFPAEWAERLDLWRKLNVPFKTLVRGRRLPDPNTVQHLFQSLLGIWPLSPLGAGDLETLRERLAGYALKAVREAKQRTSWTDPDPEFEAALDADVAAILSTERAPRLLDDVDGFARRIGPQGLRNSLSRTVLQLASPGVPDIYQGDELWNFALVDPDNRRPVDYDERIRKLDEIERGLEREGLARPAFLRELAGTMEDGRVKLHVTQAALRARRLSPAPFRSARYEPLAPAGPHANRVVAFMRGEGASRLIAAVPRLLADEDPAAWSGTTLSLPADASRHWTCALSGEVHSTDEAARLRVDRLFAILPVALLLS